MSNRHLSIFTPFHISSRENNLTRSLAILLMNEPLFLSLFYKEVTGTDFEKNFLSDGIRIDTEVIAGTLNIEDEGIKKVCGVTLNTVAYKNNLKESRDTEKPRIDLIIQMGEVLIVIEVKPSGEDPRKQLNNQIERLNWGSLQQTFTYSSLTWETILEIAFNLHNFREQLSFSNTYLNEFKNFIEHNFQELLPVVKLSEESQTSKKLAERRILQIKKEVNLKIHGDDFDEDISYIKLKNQSVAERFELYLGEKNTLDLLVWPGDNRNQGRNLYRNQFILGTVIDDIKTQFKESIPELELTAYGYTYIRFAHIMGQGVFWEDLPLKPERDVSMLSKEVGHMIYKNTLEKWEESKVSIMKYVDDKEAFLNKFSKDFEETNRNFVNINVGNQIKVSFYLNQVKKWEIENKTADYLVEGIDTIMKCINPKKEN